MKSFKFYGDKYIASMTIFSLQCLIFGVLLYRSVFLSEKLSLFTLTILVSGLLLNLVLVYKTYVNKREYNNPIGFSFFFLSKRHKHITMSIHTNNT